MSGSLANFSSVWRRRAAHWLLPVLAAASWIHGGASAQEVVRTVAGQAQEPGHADGPAAQSRFNDPAGLAVDTLGNLWVADSANHCIRRLSANGTVTTVCGQPGEPGADDGATTVARLDTPSGIAWGSEGALYIADTGNHTVRRFQGGRLTTIAGLAGDPGPTNGPATTARFNAPLGLVVHRTGAIYIADSGNHVIRRISISGQVSTLAGVEEEWGAVDGPAGRARFNGPVGLAIAPDDTLVVADALNHALRRVSWNGDVTTLAGQLGQDGCVDGPASEARFCKPAGVSFDGRGTLYVVDAFTHLVRKVATNGWVSTVAGRPTQSGDSDGANGVGRFFNPYGIVVRPNGSVIVSDTYNATLRQVLPPFAQRIVRRGSDVFLEWESVIGLRYEPWMREGLEQPWRPAGAAMTATGEASTRALPGGNPGLGPVFYQIRQNE